MYLTYKNWFWAHFSWFLGRGIYSTVWTRSGSKIKKQVMVFKGLKYRRTVDNWNRMIAEIVQCIFKSLQYQPLCFSFPPTCRRLVKRISQSGIDPLRDVPSPPRGRARNKIR